MRTSSLRKLLQTFNKLARTTPPHFDVIKSVQVDSAQTDTVAFHSKKTLLKISNNRISIEIDDPIAEAQIYPRIFPEVDENDKIIQTLPPVRE